MTKVKHYIYSKSYNSQCSLISGFHRFHTISEGTFDGAYFIISRSVAAFPRVWRGVPSWSTSDLLSFEVGTFVEGPASTSDDKTTHLIIEIQCQEVTIGAVEGQHASTKVIILKEDNGHFALRG